MSSCFWPLIDIVMDEEEAKEFMKDKILDGDILKDKNGHMEESDQESKEQ